jgi:hypothetical protein
MGLADLAFAGVLLLQDSAVLHPGPWSMVAPVPCPSSPGTEDDEFGIERRLRRIKAGSAWQELQEIYDLGRGKEKRQLHWILCSDEYNALPADVDGPLATPVFDFNTLYRLGTPQNDRVCAYLYRTIVSPEAREIEITCGSDDSIRLWLNGQLLLDHAIPRALNPGDERLTLQLQPGLNHLLVKIVNVGGAWKFQLSHPQRTDQAGINTAIDRGVEWLLDQQLIDGSWAEVQGEYRNGTTALALYTLLKSGVSPNHSAILQALAYLQAYPSERTYAAGCQLMAAAALKQPQNLWWAEETAGDLLSWQERDGGWSYPDHHTDLSLTQYAALGLRSARALGIEVPPEVWNDMAEFALNHQQSWRAPDRDPEGGFHYRPDHGFTGSMTAAGIAILHICREQLGDRIRPTIRRQLDESILAGTRWIGNHFSTRENPGQAEWHHYYLYGIERIGAFLKTERFGERDWYWEGADWLVSAQGGAGEWGDAWGSWQRNTCFSLLFLNRATARATTQPANEDPGKSRLVASDAKDAVRLKIVRQTPAVFWVDTEASDIVGVEYWIRSAGGEWQLAIESAERRFAGRFSLPRPGAWEAYAEAVRADGTRTRSSVVRFSHEEGIDDRRLGYASDSRRNRIPQQQPVVACSSEDPSFPAAGVADNRFDTRWVCKRDDLQPWIEVKLRKPVKATEMRLTHSRTCRKEAEQQNYNPRPVRVEIVFNKDEDPVVHDLDPDSFSKTVIVFPEPTKISQIRIRILAITGGTLGTNCAVGFSEIELHEGR